MTYSPKAIRYNGEIQAERGEHGEGYEDNQKIQNGQGKYGGLWLRRGI